MHCACGKLALVKLSYTELRYCKACFLHLLLRRVKKDLRERKVIRPRDTLYLLNDGSKEWFMARWLLGQIFGDLVLIKETKRWTKKGKNVRPWNAEREIQEKIRPFLTGNKIKKDSAIRLPRNLLEEEILYACKLLGYKSTQKDPEHPLIAAMEKRYAGTTFGLLKGLDELF